MSSTSKASNKERAAPLVPPPNVPPPYVSTPILFGSAVVIGYALELCRAEQLLSPWLGGKGLALVGLSVFLAGALNNYLAGATVKARVKYQVPHPIAHPAKDECKERHFFLCVVRSHENYLEFLPQFLAVLLFSTYICEKPSLAGLLGVFWIVGRFLYALGYSSGFVQRRLPGLFLSLLSYFILHGVIGWWFIKQLLV